MTGFVSRDDTNLGVGRIFTSPTAYALYENLFAFAEKASGAPVLANNYIVNAMVSNGQLGSEKFQTGTDEATWVLARTASASVGAVGTYAMLIGYNLTTTIEPGATAAGSDLRYAGIQYPSSSYVPTLIVYNTTAPAGTWRCMGRALYTATNNKSLTLWLRIA
jgi:hypothetical protein